MTSDLAGLGPTVADDEQCSKMYMICHDKEKKVTSDVIDERIFMRLLGAQPCGSTRATRGNDACDGPRARSSSQPCDHTHTVTPSLHPTKALIPSHRQKDFELVCCWYWLVERTYMRMPGHPTHRQFAGPER